MTLIKKEDVQKLIDKNHYWYSTVNTEWEPQEEYHSSEQLALQKLKKELSSLPTHDHIAVLKEMIEEENNRPIAEYMSNPEYELVPARVKILEEAISRITKQ